MIILMMSDGVSGEVGGMLELSHVICSNFLLALAFEAPFVQGCKVNAVIVHPDNEYFADVLFSTNCMVAKEGEGPILHEVTSNHWLHYQVQDHQFFNMLHKGLLCLDFVSARIVV